MRRLLTILNVVLLITLVILSLYVFDIIDFKFLEKNEEPLIEVPIADTPDKVERRKSYEEYMQKGDTFNASGLYTLAIDSYTNASEEEPDRIEPLVLIGELQILQRNYETAKNLASKILEKSPKNTDAKVILGRANIGLEQFDEAKKIFDSITIDYPDVLYYQGLMALYFGEYEKARGFLNGAVDPEKTPDSEIKNNAQRLINAMNEFDAYQAGLHEHLQVLLARAMVQNNEPHMAKDLLWKVLKEDRSYRDAWIVLGYSYLKLESFEDAIDALEEAKRQDPDKPETLFYLGLAYAGNDQLQDSIDALELALKLNYEPKIHIEQKLAELYFQIEDYETSSDKYEEVISMNASDLEYFIRPIWVYIDKLKQPNKAVALAEKASLNHPDSSMAYNLLGWAQISNNDFINGKKNLQKALTYDHSFDAPYLNLGTMYEKQGEIGRAKEMYIKAYELGNGNAVGNLAAEKYNELLANVLN
ncbi:tetratricopeptide repeat protein [Patescibacteria group bacterium]